MSYRYRRWDGTQQLDVLAPDQVLAALGDDMLTDGIDPALDRALHRGLTPEGGAAVAGLDQLRDGLRHELRRLQQLGTGIGDLPQLNAPPDGASGRTDAAPEHDGFLANADPALQPSGPASGVVPTALQVALEDLERQLRGVRDVADLGDIDLESVRAALGERAAAELLQLRESLAGLLESGLIRRGHHRRELSARALHLLGERILSQAFEALASGLAGERRAAIGAGQHELLGVSRDYRFGDPLALDLSRTLLSAVRAGRHQPLRLKPDDFAVFEFDPSQRAASVLSIDLSRSMGERGYLHAAKRLALGLATLVATRFPRDLLLLQGFAERPRLLTPADLPALTWDRFSFGTNIQSALEAAAHALRHQRGMQRQVFLLTDGEPTAHRTPDGQIQFRHPPTDETFAATYAAAERLRRDGIKLTICVLSHSTNVVTFAERLAQHGGGDMLLLQPNELTPAMLRRYRR